MITIASQPLGKNYVSHVLSRSFFVSYFCYILVLIITATILININYSWPEYQRVMIQPKVEFQLYEKLCDQNNENKSDVVRVGVHANNLSVRGQIYNNVTSCSVQIYLNVYLGQSTNFIAHLPINFQSISTVERWDIKGTISFKSSKPLPQSSILTIDQTQLGPYPYNFSSNFKASGSKTISLDSKVLYNNIYQNQSSSFFNFTANYQILSGMYMQEVLLIDKLRTFIPIFMYISIFMWWMIVNPLIDWMLRNQVYSAKAIPQKIKRE